MFPNWIPKTKSNGQVPGCNKISTEAVLESRTNTDAILTDINVTRLKDTDAYTFTQNDFVAQTLLHFFSFFEMYMYNVHVIIKNELKSSNAFQCFLFL